MLRVAVFAEPLVDVIHRERWRRVQQCAASAHLPEVGDAPREIKKMNDKHHENCPDKSGHEDAACAHDGASYPSLPGIKVASIGCKAAPDHAVANTLSASSLTGEASPCVAHAVS